MQEHVEQEDHIHRTQLRGDGGIAEVLVDERQAGEGRRFRWTVGVKSVSTRNARSASCFSRA